MTRRRSGGRSAPNRTPRPPGPSSILAQSYSERANDWRADSIPWRLLQVLRTSASLADCCALVKISPRTPAFWRTRASEILAGREPDEELCASLPVHERVYVLWAIDEAAAYASAKINPLTTLATAAGRDWRASVALLKMRWPDEFVDRREMTGPGGDPIELDVRADRIREALIEFQAAVSETPAEDPET